MPHPLSANPTKWSNTLKQLVGNLLTNCLSVFAHFVKLALKELIIAKINVIPYYAKSPHLGSSVLHVISLGNCLCTMKQY